MTALQKEYRARTKQYEYYRNVLINEQYIHEISEKIIELSNF